MISAPSPPLLFLSTMLLFSPLLYVVVIDGVDAFSVPSSSSSCYTSLREAKSSNAVPTVPAHRRRRGNMITINVGNGDEMNTIDQYSNSLHPSSSNRANIHHDAGNERRERRAIRDESSRYAIIDDDAANRRRGSGPLGGRMNRLARAASSIATGLVGGEGGNVGNRNNRPGSLILLRCGESEWTRSGRFTGWADPDLIPEGIMEIEHAGR